MGAGRDTAPGFTAALRLASVGQLGVSCVFLDQQAAGKEPELQGHAGQPSFTVKLG